MCKKMNSENRTCQSCKKIFTIASEDFDFYEKIKAPSPTWCPECRSIRRMSWRNESSLYRHVCGSCKKPIITIYSPHYPRIIYCKECWVSDVWDPKTYGIDYQEDTPFFVQFRKLFDTVPLVLADRKGTTENSEYGNYNGNCKNCYLCFSVALSEDSLYCANSQELKECMDSTGLRNGELCYEAVDSEKNYRCMFIERTRESADSSFLFGCSNAVNCFMSANIRNKSYVFRGKQMSAEDYKKEMTKIDMGDFSVVRELKNEFNAMKLLALRKHAEIKNSMNATGDNITNSKNVFYSFDVNDSENIKYSMRILKGCRDVYDCHGMVAGELVYEGFGCGFSPRNNLFSFSVDVSRNLIYCAMCHDSSDCFGCVGLKNQHYCILNKQYEEKEYKELVTKIKNLMDKVPYIDTKGRVYGYGEFFPSELSPFGYNETIAQDNFPITKEEAVTQGFLWKDDEKKNHIPTIFSDMIPKNITDVDESITSEIIQCEHKGSCNERCSSAFKVTPQEFLLYKKLSVPIPHLCPSCRHFERLKRRNSLKLWHRQCMCGQPAMTYQNTAIHEHGSRPCPNGFETSYPPERPEIVYCEQCYQKEVV